MNHLGTIPILLALVATSGHRLADEPKSSWITFLSHRTGGNLLYRMHPDGSGLESIFGGELKDVPGLAKGMTWYREPHWTRQSPDGRFFLSWTIDRVEPLQRRGPPPRFLLHLGRTDGGPTRLITPDSEEHFSWSPDSRRFAYSRSQGKTLATLRYSLPPRTELVIAQVDGTSEDLVLDRPGVWVPLDWSPDGTRLLVAYQTSLIFQRSSSALFELDLVAAREEISRLRSNPARSEPEKEGEVPSGGGLRVVLPLKRTIGCGSARYSPDGKSIALVESTLVPPKDDLIDPAKYASSFELRVRNLESKQDRVICHESDIFGGPICWSPDGSQILFARTGASGKVGRLFRTPSGDDGLAIWSVGADGGNLHKLTSGWCPDWRVR